MSKARVECKECGNEYKYINDSHLQKHNLDVDSYKKKYPNADIVAEETRNKWSKNMSELGDRRKKEIDLGRVKELLTLHIPITKVADYFNVSAELIEKRQRNGKLEIHPSDYRLPECHRMYINRPVEEVVNFWSKVDEYQDSKITFYELINYLSKQLGWNYSTLKSTLKRFDIAKDIHTYRGIPRKLNVEECNLCLSENYTVNALDSDDLMKLKNYGCDFLYKDSILVESKKTLNNLAVKSAIAQLLYGERRIDAEIDQKWIFVKNVVIGKKHVSVFRYISEFDIQIYTLYEGEMIEVTLDNYKDIGDKK